MSHKYAKTAWTNNQYAQISWTVNDIKTLRPRWSDEVCEKFLCNNENNIRDRMIEHGWAVIESLLEYEENKASKS